MGGEWQVGGGWAVGIVDGVCVVMGQLLRYNVYYYLRILVWFIAPSPLEYHLSWLKYFVLLFPINVVFILFNRNSFICQLWWYSNHGMPLCCKPIMVVADKLFERQMCDPFINFHEFFEFLLQWNGCIFSRYDFAMLQEQDLWRHNGARTNETTTTSKVAGLLSLS